MTAPITRRDLIRRASGLLVAAAVAAPLTIAGTAKAEAEFSHDGYCPTPFGPLHTYLWNTGPDPVWQHAVILRESQWDPSATNPSSGAAGLCQFMWGTWQDAEQRSGIYGSPYDGYTAIDMMNWLVRNGERFHWYCNGEAGCSDV